MERIGKKVEFYNIKEQETDYKFWKLKTPQERIYALEYLRDQYLTDSNGIRQRLQRVLSVTKPK